MDDIEFTKLLKKVSILAFQVAKEYVSNELKERFKYDVELNKSMDIPRVEKFDHYPEDNSKNLKNLKEEDVIKLLLRGGKIPVWIDINVKTIRNDYTILNLICAGRYSNDKKEFYYEKRNTGPFGIKSPYLPSNYKEGLKFKI